MAVSIKSLIDTSLRKLGLIGSGEQADPSEYADALQALRTMLDAWSLEDLLIPFQATEQFALDPAKAHYAMGIGGDWDTTRPERVEIVRVLQNGDSYPLTPTSAHERSWQARVETGQPRRYIATADSLFAWIELDAYPEAGMEVLVTSLKPFDVAALDNFDTAYDPDAAPETVYPSGFTLTGIQTPISFPSGYQAAIESNLAVRLAAEYPGVALPPVVVAEAAGTLALIKRRNRRVLRTTLPRDLLMLRGCRP